MPCRAKIGRKFPTCWWDFSRFLCAEQRRIYGNPAKLYQCIVSQTSSLKYGATDVERSVWIMFRIRRCFRKAFMKKEYRELKLCRIPESYHASVAPTRFCPEREFFQRATTVNMLRHLGCDVVFSASSASHAWHALYNVGPVDIAFCDLRTEGLDSLDFCNVRRRAGWCDRSSSTIRSLKMYSGQRDN